MVISQFFILLVFMRLVSVLEGLDQDENNKAIAGDKSGKSPCRVIFSEAVKIDD